MILNGEIISKDKNKFLKKGSELTNTKGSGLSNVKKYGSGLRILQ